MKSKRFETGKNCVKMEDGEGFSADQLGGEVKVADMIWVKIPRGSWWPAQVVDDNAVSGNNKPSKRPAGKVLVRIYGSYKYLDVDPLKCRSDFDLILEQNNGCYRELFLKSLEQVVSCSKYGRSKNQGSKSKVGASNQETDASNLHLRISMKTGMTSSKHTARRTSPRRLRNVIIPQTKVENKNVQTRRAEDANSKASKRVGRKPNMPIATEEVAKRKSSREDGLQKKLKRNGLSDQAQVLSKSQEVSARRLRVMQNLGLIAPSGSPYNRNGHI